MKERRPLALLLLTTAFLFGVAAFGRLVDPEPATPVPAPGEGAVPAKPAPGNEVSAPERRPKAVSREQRHQRLVSAMWWHRAPIANDLGLSEPQKTAMDRLLLEYLERRDQPVGSELRQQFRGALSRGDLTVAMQTLDELSVDVAAASLSEPRFKLAVLSVLEPEQLAAAVERRPKLLTARWLLQLGQGGRRGSAPQQGEPLQGELQQGEPQDAGDD